jgi:aminobenzoyl-glutamate transport protein
VTYKSINPVTHQAEQMTTRVESLLTGAGIRFMYANVVRNFMSFTALGVLIVAMLGVGVAEVSGLVGALIHKLVQVAPASTLTYILVFLGVVSSVAADAGYLVLIPLAAAAFLSVGRNPLAGLALGFAAVAAVFSVNIIVTPLDGILTEIANDAIHLVNPSVSISLTANFWFSVASVVMLTVVCGLITDKIVEPRLGPYTPPTGLQEDLRSAQGSDILPADRSRGLKYATWGLVSLLIAFALVAIPAGAPLRNPETGALIGDSPFMTGLIVAIALAFLVMGAAYGLGARTMKGSADVIRAMEKTVIALGPLIFLFFFVSQFIAFFSYTNIATIAAVRVGDTLEHVGLGPIPLLVGFVLVRCLLTLVMPQIIPAWAVVAPVFVPLLMRLHVSPEAVLAAYRVGDSPFNVISPAMAYLPPIIGFASRYRKDAGLGTIMAMMLPYVIIVQVVWIVLLIVWQALGIPWGF